MHFAPPTLRAVSGPEEPLDELAVEEVVFERRERSPAGSAHHPLSDPRRYWLCAPGADGMPDTKPVWGLWLDGSVLFSADAESIVVPDPRGFNASVVHLEDGDGDAVVDGVAVRVEDASTLVRFAAACEAKYGFPIEPDDPDLPVYCVWERSDIGWEADDAAASAADWEFEPLT